jgi:hypothetical protein
VGLEVLVVAAAGGDPAQRDDAQGALRQWRRRFQLSVSLTHL